MNELDTQPGTRPGTHLPLWVEVRDDMTPAEPLPKYVQIEPVGQCNLRCTMCAIQFRHDGPPYGPVAFMPFERYTSLVDQFVGLEHLHLQGLGEPMMHPRFFDMVSYAADRGIRVTTNSNLTLVNDRRAELLITSGLDTLHISLDGATAETYERIRVNASFDRVIRNIERVLNARERLRATSPRLHMVMVIMRQNLAELPELVRLAHTFEMDEVFVQHLSHDFTEESLPEHYASMRRYVDDQTLLHEDPARVRHFFAEARSVAALLDVKLRLPRTQPKPYAAGTPGRDRCDWPWSGAYIAYDGSAMPCCMISTPDRATMGNMIEQGVAPVWNGPAYRSFRAALASEQVPAVCQACSLYHGTF